MTGRAAIPGEDVSEECINEMEKEICEVRILKNDSEFYMIWRFRELQDYFTIWLQSRPARPSGNRHNFKLPDFFVFSFANVDQMNKAIVFYCGW